MWVRRRDINHITSDTHDQQQPMHSRATTFTVTLSDPTLLDSPYTLFSLRFDTYSLVCATVKNYVSVVSISTIDELYICANNS